MVTVKLPREQWTRPKNYMEYQAISKYIRTSTRKMRLVADSIRPFTPVQAITKLSVLPKQAGRPMRVVIESAVANAKQKNADPTKLRFKIIDVSGGPVMKRGHAVSRGSAHAYKKRMTHVRVVLTDEEQTPSAGEKKGK